MKRCEFANFLYGKHSPGTEGAHISAFRPLSAVLVSLRLSLPLVALPFLMSLFLPCAYAQKATVAQEVVNRALAPTGTSTVGPTSPTTTKGSTFFNNGNIGSVSNRPSQPTTFTIREPYVITLVENYHWNNARGATPGTIGLRGSDGINYGPWRAAGAPGPAGVPNAYWSVHPNMTLPGGTYTVVDSDPATWAHNSTSFGRGFARVEGYPASPASGGQTSGAGGQTSGSGQSTAGSFTVMAEITNKSKQNAHVFVEGESFSPSNRLAPGESRKVPVRMQPDGSVTFKAGRDGQVMGTRRWTGEPGNTGGVPVVVFDDTNPFDRLSVTTGLR
jgi:hypothetical protein